jgi:ferritin-like metal-binding protein YciE
VSSREDTLIQHLNGALATELALVSTLRAHIAMTPRGSYRSLLERHLGETQRQADRLRRRISDLGVSRSLAGIGVGAVQSVIGQVLSLAKTPLDVLRGGGGEEKLLRNAMDECATEALEIATYDVLEQVALELGDPLTAEMAEHHRAEEETMLAALRTHLPALARDAVAAEVFDHDRYEASQVGAADAARGATREARDAAETASGVVVGISGEVAGRAEKAASKATGAAKRTAKQARRLPGEEEVEGEIRGAVAGEDDLPIANYDSLNAGDIVERLPRLTQVELGAVDAYERRHSSRKTIISKVDSLRGDEPWAGYDEHSVEEVEQRVRDADEDEARKVRDYERRHKGRKGVIEAAQRSVAAD